MQSDSNLQISIVVPAYNAANYLERCIESMAHQDLPYDCYEVIVINDGSTDHSVEILDALCSKYSFLRYVTTANGGLSRARNRGVKEAVGKYLLFVDSDDSISPYVLKRIWQEMELDNLDMMLMNYVHIAVDGSSLAIPFQIDNNPRVVVSGREFLLRDAYPPMVWTYVYKHSFLVENSLAMIPIWHEDEEFTPRAVYLASRIKYYPLLCYNYFQNKESYIVSYKESNLLYVIQAMASLIQFSRNLDLESKKYFEERVAKTLMQLFKGSICRGYQNQAEMIEEMQRLKLLPLRPKHYSFYYLMLNVSPFLFERYYRYRKHKIKNKK